MEINIEQLMKTAIEEMKGQQYTEAAKHFDIVVMSDPSEIDAPFFRAYCNCHDITLGEMSNAANGFTNAFKKYVDDVKALNVDENVKKEKLEYAVELLTKLVEHYKYNSKQTMLTAPSIGMSISGAATTMNLVCMNKIYDSNIKLSQDVLSENSSADKSNDKTGCFLIALVLIGALAFGAWLGWGIFF